MEVTVVVPTKDEEETVVPFLKSIASLKLGLLRCLVVDDSSDRTREVVNSLSMDGLKAKAILGRGNESPSVRLGIESSDEYCVVIDCDGSQDTGIIPEMLGKLSEGADLVVGSRYCKGGHPGDSTIFSSVGNLFGRFVLGLKTKDTTGRFFAAKRDLLLKASKWDGRGENSIDVVYFFEKRGYNVVEVPFKYSSRIGGRSKTNIPKYLWKYFWKIIDIRVRSWKVFSDDFIQRGINADFIEEVEVEVGSIAKVVGWLQIPIYLLMCFPARIPILEQFFGLAAINWPRGIVGFWLRTCYWRPKLGGCGSNCFFDYGMTIFGSENVFLGNNVHIDERVSMICASGKISIGEHVHIAGSCVLQGKGGIEIEEGATISFLTKIYSATNYYRNERGELVSCSAMAPPTEQYVIKKKVRIGKCGFLGAGSCIIPGGSIGDYSTVGASSVVNKEIPARTVAIGSPAKVIKEI